MLVEQPECPFDPIRTVEISPDPIGTRHDIYGFVTSPYARHHTKEVLPSVLYREYRFLSSKRTRPAEVTLYLEEALVRVVQVVCPNEA